MDNPIPWYTALTVPIACSQACPWSPDLTSAVPQVMAYLPLAVSWVMAYLPSAVSWVMA